LIAGRCAKFRRLADVTPGDGLKRSAVAITIVPADDSNAGAFLLTRRAATLRSHKGQWALPGGRCDPGETPLVAALREIDEELGVRLFEDDLLGVLDDYPTRSGYLITPLVFWGGAISDLHPNPQEVASVYRIPLAQIVPDDVVAFISIPESDRRVIRLRINESWVHAPTAAVIYQFREVLAGRETRVGDLEQPVFAWK
jgi:8-oxo-dGTP pyrophosphatase MutT (NUDIX family)